MSFVPNSFVAANALKADDAVARDAFVRDVLASGVCFVVEGADGKVRVPSPRHPGCHVELLWSDRAEATRWASVLATKSQIRAVALHTLIAEHLPSLTVASVFAGPDWSDLPAEPEVTGAELSYSLRRALAVEFAAAAHTTRQVWLLKDANGLVTLTSTLSSTAQVLPVFATHEQAASHATAQIVTPVRQPMAEFLSKTLMTCIVEHWRLAPAYMPGPDVLELAPWDMKALLHGSPQSRRVA
ncbi:MAG: DUF2750 domain-containing protein [Hyphomicrobiaceae bacterium]|nr:DUF2750 domain-containing protein [Hyphomicrobiaceae bacterium]